MMRSLYSGVSGMRTHQTKMDVIGNNIANVNTVAYKSSSITFGELMYQTMQNASGPNALTGTAGVNAKQIGLGVQAGAINTNIAQSGAAQTTGNPFDVKINGDAFFVVSDGSNNYFTRAGAFYVDGGGNLAMTSNGYNVMGWGVDETGMAIKKDTVTALRIMSEENMSYPPEATSKGYVAGIIDKNDTDVNSSNGKVINLKFYDNLGYSYTAKFTIRANSETPKTGNYSIELKDVLDANNKSVMNEYPNISLGGPSFIQDNKQLTLATGLDLTKLTYKDADGNEQQVDVTNKANIDLTNKELMDALAKAYGCADAEDFLSYTISIEDPNNAGQMINVSLREQLEAGKGLEDLVAKNADGSVGDPAKNPIMVTGRNYVGGVINYDVDTGYFKGINGQTTATSLMLNMPYGNFSNIEVDFKTSSMFDNAGTSTIGATNGDTDGAGKGRKLGELSGISIQTNGMIYASYDNGMNRLLGQIAVAEFANPSGLEKMGENLYQATLNSGQFDGIGVDISANGGSMNTGVLEMSNVDLSQEFTEMITTQRGFQANSRIITVSDTLLEELVNLKR